MPDDKALTKSQANDDILNIIVLYLFALVSATMISINLMTAYSVSALFSLYDLRNYMHFQTPSSFDFIELFKIPYSPFDISTILFKVNLKHRHRGNLMVSLVSAEGTTSKLATARQHDRYSQHCACCC